ncbi:MAG: hypothetical protein AAF732_00965 [Pseudomonadota bacterium]
MSLRVLVAVGVFMIAASSVRVSAAEAPRDGAVELAQACGWYAIATCSRRPGPARRSAGRIGGYVVLTDNIGNFEPGWFCAVIGPQGKPGAWQDRDFMRSAGEDSAYIKYGC